MSIRDKVQQDALDIALRHKRCSLAISMGVGKTLIGLRYLQEHQIKGELRKVLVVAPKLSIFQTWKEDAEKFGIPEEVTGKIEYTTYLSLHKHNPSDYDTLVLDECHSLLPTHEVFLAMFNGRILGLTGTPPRYHNSDKGQMVSKYCPTVFRYITDNAVDDKILNDYRIIVHRLALSPNNNMEVRTKKGVFYTSEQKSYDYWSARLNNAPSRKEEKIISVMRMKSMMGYPTKERYAAHLLSEIEDKCIVFCNTQAQADRLCTHSVHSENPDAEENLELFKRDRIQQLSCVLQLSEGVNIPNLRAGIIMHAYGNERKSSQRIGRLLRLNPKDKATVHILCFKNTVDERWVTEALKDFDSAKIKYHDVKAEEYESLHG